MEAHGTGTVLGDPIEIAGLTQAFGQHTQARGSICAIGSAKSNIGHLESAAGIGGTNEGTAADEARGADVLLSLHAQELNPHIDFEQTPSGTAAAWSVGSTAAGGAQRRRCASARAERGSAPSGQAGERAPDR